MILAICLVLAGCKKNGTNEKVMEIIGSESYTADNIKQIARLIEHSDDLTDEEAKNLYMEVGNFIRMYAEHLTDSLNDRMNDPNLSGEEMKELLQEINRLGEEMDETGVEVFKVEGLVVYGIAPIFIPNMFKGYITEHEYHFAEIEQMEYDSPSIIDDEVVVSYQEIANRLWECDQMMMDTACSEEIKPSIEALINSYMITLMFGTENSSAFDWRTGMMNSDIKDAILNYVSDHPEAYSAETLKRYIEVLEKSKYYETPATRQFFYNFIRPKKN